MARPYSTTKPTKPLAPAYVRVDRLVTGELAVECWCQRAVVYVMPRVVWSLKTDTCGRRDCVAPDG